VLTTLLAENTVAFLKNIHLHLFLFILYITEYGRIGSHTIYDEAWAVF
jgi:hypothetical protein